MNRPLHVGLDLGGTNIKVVVLEGLGESIQPTPIFRQTTPTEAEGGPQHVVDRLVKIVTEIKASIGEIQTIGLGVPGLFDGETGTIEFLPNLLGAWKGFQIVAATGSRMGTDPVLINDARAFALAEGTLGAGKDAAVMLGIVLGTGIGGGIMINGRLHTGAYGMAGEVGHQTVLPDGPICGCGNRGCIEALARGDVVAAAAGVADTKSPVCGLGSGRSEGHRGDQDGGGVHRHRHLERSGAAWRGRGGNRRRHRLRRRRSSRPHSRGSVRGGHSCIQGSDSDCPSSLGP